jgi:plastocyanin
MPLVDQMRIRRRLESVATDRVPFPQVVHSLIFNSLAMFAASLSMGLALMPFVSAAIHNIQVGAAGKLLYEPEAIGAAPGDQVVFHFHPKNHTVTQSSFADPCGRKDGGFTSGFQPVPANQTDNLPTYTVNVVDTEPIWVYCAQALRTPNSHCGAGMVFAINCGPDGAPNSFTNFKNSALAIGASLKAAAPSSTPSTGGYYPPPPPAAVTNAYTTAAYGGYTIPPAPYGTPVTQAVTVGASSWMTTYTSYPNSPAPTPASLEGQVHKVIVGGPGTLAFNPPFVSALPRDTVVFEFHQKNHSVVQSSFDDPCRKISKDGVTGFDSGFQPVADGATEFPTWNFTVTTTEPIWAYCSQRAPASHCGAGMVFALNSDESSGRSFSAYQNVAKTLNGTAAAIVAPSATPTGGATSIKIGFASVSVFMAMVLGAVL